MTSKRDTASISEVDMAARSQPILASNGQPEAELAAAEHMLRHRTRQLARTSEAWCKAAEAALALVPGASNSSHPAHSLWLRVEMHRATPVEVVLS